MSELNLIMRLRIAALTEERFSELLKEAADELAQTNNDAAAYRYLREHSSFNSDKAYLRWYLPRRYDGGTYGQQLDDAIDSALKC